MKQDLFKKVCVVGFKKSGMSVCKLALSLGKKVRVTETGSGERFPFYTIDKFKNWGVEFEFNQHSKNFIKDCDLVIVSPGVDMKNSLAVKIAHSLGILTVGEIEFASWFNKGDIIAITGTNGKTTTAFLTYLVLKNKTRHVYLGGNIGVPFSSFVLNTKSRDIVVLEVSSFQLETIREFKPKVSCVTNIEPDHFDRYAEFGEYVKAKRNIFRNQRGTDFAVLNRRMARETWIREIRAKLKFFQNELDNENFSAAYKIASIFGVTKSSCQRVFTSFKGLPHRMQVVENIRGVTFINDSKATNPSSTIWALKNMKRPVILIAGGKDKGMNYHSVSPFLKNVKKINLFGEAKDKIKKSLNTYNNIIEIFPNLKETIISSFKEAREKDVILFSPMCASFDSFSDYKERGRFFIKVVKEISSTAHLYSKKMNNL